MSGKNPSVFQKMYPFKERFPLPCTQLTELKTSFNLIFGLEIHLEYVCVCRFSCIHIVSEFIMS